MWMLWKRFLCGFWGSWSQEVSALLLHFQQFINLVEPQFEHKTWTWKRVPVLSSCASQTWCTVEKHGGKCEKRVRRKTNKVDLSHNIISQIKPNEVQRISDFSWQLTFALKTFFSQDADKGQELGDLFQVEHSGVVELDYGHGLLVVGTAAAILPQAGVAHQNTTVFRGENGK